ncbi:MAG TPA: RidA family protein [Gemmatimonadales bacterium]|jgi:enamine deaminase RidA (YjgF/YER057c/UK114 family)|nr:RidA family protein [Gemmatimonadales bacterium]
MTKRAMAVLAVVTLAPAMASAQGVPGGPPGGMGGPDGRSGLRAPNLPGLELEGPMDSATARLLLDLTDQQAGRYAQAYDSFMVATRPQRDSARVTTGKMNDRLDSGDRAAATFYAERLQELGKYLKNQQDRFERAQRSLLTDDQARRYRQWKETEQRAIADRQREDALRWQQPAAFGQRVMPAPEPKTSLPPSPGTPRPDLGAQAVRVGRALYVTSQLAVDSAGTLVGADIRAQAERAFANLTAVLRAAGASPADVVALTIYVVDYQPTDLATLRAAGAAYFGPNPPTVTLLGVQSVGRDGALVAVGATAVTATAAPPRGAPRD